LITKGAKDKCWRKRDKNQSSGTDDDNWNLQAAGAANHRHQKIEHPDQCGARENGG
jgi:hypothetical protein